MYHTLATSAKALGLMALWSSGPLPQETRLVCMDSNVHEDVSPVTQAILRTGWVDVAEGKGDTFGMTYQHTYG